MGGLSDARVVVRPISKVVRVGADNPAHEGVILLKQVLVDQTCGIKCRHSAWDPSVAQLFVAERPNHDGWVVPITADEYFCLGRAVDFVILIPD